MSLYNISGFGHFRRFSVPCGSFVVPLDLLKHPEMARGDQIVAMPTLVIKLPQAVRKIIGDLSNTDRVLVGLALQELG